MDGCAPERARLPRPTFTKTEFFFILTNGAISDRQDGPDARRTEVCSIKQIRGRRCRGQARHEYIAS